MSDKVYTIEELRVILQDILKKFAVKKAILFGSYAKNTSTSKSDIDLVIDSEGKLLNIYFYGLLEDLVEKLQKNVDLFEISEIQKDSRIYNDIQNEGVIVYEK
ncbi:MAG: nucleotidyltransferase domain-containing protein [Clostridia bacterium]|nr:nucleotidyltransferase domain-containing protein [Clostridia bacterium]